MSVLQTYPKGHTTVRVLNAEESLKNFEKQINRTSEKFEPSGYFWLIPKFQEFGVWIFLYNIFLLENVYIKEPLCWSI